MREAIRRHQREAIGSHQHSVLGGFVPDEGGNQWRSVAISGNQWQSWQSAEASTTLRGTRGTPRHSAYRSAKRAAWTGSLIREAIRGNQRPSAHLSAKRAAWAGSCAPMGFVRSRKEAGFVRSRFELA
jgi:hypothetical protein